MAHWDPSGGRCGADPMFGIEAGPAAAVERWRGYVGGAAADEMLPAAWWHDGGMVGAHPTHP